MQDTICNGVGTLISTHAYGDTRDEWLEPLREFKKQKNKKQLKFKYMELFILRAKLPNGGTTGKEQFTDKENLEKAIKELKWQEGVDKVYVNKAVMTISGFFWNGDYVGEF